MLFAYGGNSYKIANFAKKINSGIKIWINYSKLKENIVFRDRIIYLPNCVSEFKVDEVQVDSITLRKNVIIACGRIGEYVKNHELLLEAVALLPKEGI